MRLTPVIAALTATAAALGPAAALAPTAAGQGPARATCFWFGPMGFQDPATNLAYPDKGALYWGARFRIPEGSALRLEGTFPHARYMSLNAYGRVNGVEHAAVDDLDDVSIEPDAGSINPYRPGAHRYATNRSYTLTMTAGQASDQPNVIDAPPTNEGAVQELIYRVYLPDSDADRSAQSLPNPVLTLASGQELRDQVLCDAVNDTQQSLQFQTMPPDFYKALVNLPGGDPATNPAFSPLRWEKYLNQPLALSVYRVGTDTARLRIADLRLGEIGGFYDNRSVKYSVGPVGAKYGKVLVLKGKLPTTPATGPDVATMGSGQMRYWSICQNGSPVTTNTISCLSDVDVAPVLAKGRKYTIVLSRRADRPRNARTSCKVAWLDWGNQRDPLGRMAGTLVMRNLLSDPSFARSLQKVTVKDIDVLSRTNKPQQKVMGDYQPTGKYTSKKVFEKRGCAKS